MAQRVQSTIDAEYERDRQEDESTETTGDDEVIQKVNSAYEASKRNQGGYFTLFRDLWRLWRFYKSAGSYVKVVNPIGFAMTVGLLSKMFMRMPDFLLVARTGGWKWLQKILESYLKYQFDNPKAEEPVSEEYVSFVTEMLVTGTAWYKVHWCTKYHTKFEERIDPITGEMTRDSVRVIAYDDPIFEHVPNENVYWEPGARNVDQSKYIIFEQFVSESQLRELGEIIDPMTGEPVYAYIEEAIAGKASGSEAHDPSGVKAARKATGTDTSEENKDKFHLIEYWEDDKLCVLIDKKWVSRNEDNPFDAGYKPFGNMQYVKVPHEMCGIGALEPVSDLLKAQNITITQRLEYISNLLQQQWAVAAGAEVDEDALMDGYPVVHMATTDAVVPLNKGQVPQAAFVETQEIVGAIERGMGISGYQVGAPAAAQDRTQGTATGIQTIVAEAQTRFDLTMRRFEQIVLKKVARLYLDLNKQYFPETEQRIILVTDGNGQQQPVPLTKELLNLTDWHIDIVPGSTGAVDKARKAQSFMRWTTFAMSVIPNFDRQAAVMEAADYEDIENPERFVLQAPPMAPGLPAGQSGMPMEQGQEMPQEAMPMRNMLS